MDVKQGNIQDEKISSNPVLVDIRDEWYWIKPALEELKEQIPSLTWRVEDVYAECLYGNALLYTAAEGFVIINVMTDQYTKERTLFFWIAWAKGVGGSNVINYLPFFEDVGKQLECSSLETWTPVNELEPYFCKNGWDLSTRVFTRRIDEHKTKSR